VKAGSLCFSSVSQVTYDVSIRPNLMLTKHHESEEIFLSYLLAVEQLKTIISSFLVTVV
jgi:hypothetical protein